MKKVLLTNFRIKEFTGSELDILTIANYFLNNNFEVDVFTLEKGIPLLEKFDQRINIITPDDVDRLEKKYDIMWAHHFPLLDYILFKKQVVAKHIIYISLSPFEAYECVPVYFDKISIIACITQETKDKLIKEFQNINKKEITVFPNYAPIDYFNNKIVKPNKIKKVCIVSNHVPEELEEFRKIALLNNITVDIYGINHTTRFVDQKLLKNYDLIISIGKTVYYALSLGIPVYCYDYFGGYGYIKPSNIEKTFFYNFSGRVFGIKKKGQEIYNDIIDNYNFTIQDLKDNRKFAWNNFCFEKNMNKLLKKLNKNNQVDCDKLLVNYNYLVRSSELFIREVMNRNNNIVNRKNEFYQGINKLHEECNKINESLREKSNQIENILNSSSWKFTKPYRYLCGKIKHIITIIGGLKNER